MSLGEPTVSSGTPASLSLQVSLTLFIFLSDHVLPRAPAPSGSESPGPGLCGQSTYREENDLAQARTAFLKCLLAFCLQKAASNQIFMKENTVKRVPWQPIDLQKARQVQPSPKSNAHDLGVSGTPNSSSH